MRKSNMAGNIIDPELYSWAVNQLQKQEPGRAAPAKKPDSNWALYIAGGVLASLLVLWMAAIVLTKKSPDGQESEEGRAEGEEEREEGTGEETGEVEVGSGENETGEGEGGEEAAE